MVDGLRPAAAAAVAAANWRLPWLIIEVDDAAAVLCVSFIGSFEQKLKKKIEKKPKFKPVQRLSFFFFFAAACVLVHYSERCTR